MNCLLPVPAPNEQRGPSHGPKEPVLEPSSTLKEAGVPSVGSLVITSQPFCRHHKSRVATYSSNGAVDVHPLWRHRISSSRLVPLPRGVGLCSSEAHQAESQSHPRHAPCSGTILLACLNIALQSAEHCIALHCKGNKPALSPFCFLLYILIPGVTHRKIQW